jgi:hypothetical protein
MESVPNQRRYRIVIRGRLSDRLGSAFPEMSLERHPGQTVMAVQQTRRGCTCCSTGYATLESNR